MNSNSNKRKLYDFTGIPRPSQPQGDFHSLTHTTNHKLFSQLTDNTYYLVEYDNKHNDVIFSAL